MSMSLTVDYPTKEEWDRWLVDLDHANALVEYAERERDELWERWRAFSLPIFNELHSLKP